MFINIVLLVLFTTMVLPALLVAIGIPFRKCTGQRTFTNGKMIYQFELPDWLKWLHNPIDGLTGDRRGWYWFEYTPKYIPQSIWKRDAFKMFWWSGVRNPLNYFKRIVIGVDVREHTIKKLVGQDFVRDKVGSTGFQILYAVPHDGGFIKPMLYYTHIFKDGKGVCIQLGWKLKLSHNTDKYVDVLDYYKGMTFEVQLWKTML